MSRASHYSAKQRHAQREFGVAKAKLQPVGTDTAWVAEFISSAQGIRWFNVNSMICMPLGHTVDERELKLRRASSMGLLRMFMFYQNGVFKEYRWELA